MKPYVTSFEDLFGFGMKRELGRLHPEPDGTVLNLGSGDFAFEDAINLDQPSWRAPMLRDFDDKSVAVVHAYHFLEHLTSSNVYRMLEEIERVLRPAGVFYYCVPWSPSAIAYSTIDHQTFWTEEWMPRILENRGYTHFKDKWELKLTYQVIAGVASQNLAVLGQLLKE